MLIDLNFSEKSIVSDDELYKVLNIIHLKKNSHDDTQQLSGDGKQSLTLGRVILMIPEILLLDKPSSSLDEKTEEIIITSLMDYI